MKEFIVKMLELGAEHDQCVTSTEKGIVEKEAIDLYKKHVEQLTLGDVGKELKDKKRPTFEFWLDLVGAKQVHDIYIFENDQVSVEWLVEKYIKETDL